MSWHWKYIVLFKHTNFPSMNNVTKLCRTIVLEISVYDHILCKLASKRCVSGNIHWQKQIQLTLLHQHVKIHHYATLNKEVMVEKRTFLKIFGPIASLYESSLIYSPKRCKFWTFKWP